MCLVTHLESFFITVITITNFDTSKLLKISGITKIQFSLNTAGMKNMHTIQTKKKPNPFSHFYPTGYGFFILILTFCLFFPCKSPNGATRINQLQFTLHHSQTINFFIIGKNSTTHGISLKLNKSMFLRSINW